MLKNYLEEKKLSMYKVSKEGGIPYSTLNDLVNGRVEIENCKVSLLLQLAKYLGLSLDEIYAVTNSNGIEVKAKTAGVPTGKADTANCIEITKDEQNPDAAETAASAATESETAVSESKRLPDFESMLHKMLEPGEYIAASAENKLSLFQLMISAERKEDENDFDFLRRICKKGGMAEDAFKKGLAYIIMTDYVLAQQDRSLENVFIETDGNGGLKRFVLPEATGAVLFLNKEPKGDEVTNRDIAFLKKKERKLLKLVADKSVIGIDQLPSKNELEKLLAESEITGKKIKKICGFYQERLAAFTDWMAE